MSNITESEIPFDPDRRAEKLNKLEYRSPGLRPGALNEIGLPHVHIDGARDPDLVYKIVRDLEDQGDLGKFNRVIHSVAGRQRQEIPEVYESHTPAIAGEEALDFFSSSTLKDRVDAVKAVNLIGDRIKNTPGAIVEVEQVWGWYDSRGWKWIDKQNEMLPIEQGEADFTPQPTWDFEIHHGFNLPKTSEDFPIKLEKLLEDCEAQGIVLGGWFVFNKGDEWAYRSNSFSKDENIRQVVEREQATLNSILASYGQNFQARSLVERVLGIWKSETK